MVVIGRAIALPILSEFMFAETSTVLKSKIYLLFFLKDKVQNTELYAMKVATYDYDPELLLEDEIQIVNFEIGNHKFTFDAKVIARNKRIVPQKPADLLEIIIMVQPLDKQMLINLSNLLIQLHPGKFEFNYPANDQRV